MEDILVQGRPLVGHGDIWHALYVAPAAKGGILHVVCYYKVKATRNDDGPKNNMGQDAGEFDERWSYVSLEGYVNGEARVMKQDMKFEQQELSWIEDVRLEASYAASILVIRSNRWADPLEWRLQLAFTTDP
ncbi:hypothetical protein [Telluria aromaticivorans]|uniref:Uncharacterized protein n=1 Tax=Telluria aromaticivorans TaxID=2725995 RepID=A0A7Y2P128_9BURK|nr:hypothetical protein [Telluria aromaticivorans]NNG25542.1 hypothetical protein [Telluria aromaticivorans]